MRWALQFLGKIKTPAQWTHLKELTLNGRILCLAQELPGLPQPDILSSLLAWEKDTPPPITGLYIFLQNQILNKTVRETLNVICTHAHGATRESIKLEPPFSLRLLELAT